MCVLAHVDIAGGVNFYQLGVISFSVAIFADFWFYRIFLLAGHRYFSFASTVGATKMLESGAFPDLVESYFVAEWAFMKCATDKAL